MRKRVVTISREFGSGGRSVGRMVAEKLGYDFYDQELILHVVLESGLSEELVRKYDEYATHRSSLLYSIALSGGAAPFSGNMSFATQVQVAQTKVITDLAKKGNCVIVGRGGDYVLRGREDCLHTFIYADMDYRADRIVRLYGERADSPQKRLEDKDQRRKLYYKSFAMREWGDYKNYDIMLSTSGLGLEMCADIIVGIVEESKDW